MPSIFIIALVVLGLVSCEDSKKTTKISPEISSEISRIQAENGLTDEQMTDALKRWVQIHAGTKELLKSDDLLGEGEWTPERVAEMIAESEKALKAIRHEDQMLAVYSLGHLSALHDKRYEETADSLRGIIARHYMAIKDQPNEAGKSFLHKVQELSEADPKLKSLLEQTSISR